MEMLDKRLNDKGKNWRHVFKSLTVLDYLLHAGSENVVIYFRDNLYVIKTLKEFQYVDEYGKDQGANVRQKAKDISNLLMDEARLRQERRSRANMRDRMIGNGRDDSQHELENENENVSRRSRSLPPTRRRGGAEDDDELKRAIEESKRSLAEEQVSAAGPVSLIRPLFLESISLIQARKGVLTAEERDLQEAIRLSEEAERKRNEDVTKANQNSLFDDNNNLYGPVSNDLICHLMMIFKDQHECSNKSIPSCRCYRNRKSIWRANTVHSGMRPVTFYYAHLTCISHFQQVPQFTSFNPYEAQMQQEALQVSFVSLISVTRGNFTACEDRSRLFA